LTGTKGFAEISFPVSRLATKKESVAIGFHHHRGVLAIVRSFECRAFMRPSLILSFPLML
jgi:hypothetical protein